MAADHMRDVAADMASALRFDRRATLVLAALVVLAASAFIAVRFVFR